MFGKSHLVLVMFGCVRHEIDSVGFEIDQLPLLPSYISFCLDEYYSIFSVVILEIKRKAFEVFLSQLFKYSSLFVTHF